MNKNYSIVFLLYFIQESICKKQKMEVTYKVGTDVADYAREFEAKQAAFNVEVKTAVSWY